MIASFRQYVSRTPIIHPSAAFKNQSTGNFIIDLIKSILSVPCDRKFRILWHLKAIIRASNELNNVYFLLFSCYRRIIVLLPIPLYPSQFILPAKVARSNSLRFFVSLAFETVRVNVLHSTRSMLVRTFSFLFSCPYHSFPSSSKMLPSPFVITI